MAHNEITEVFLPKDKNTICRFCLNLSSNLLFIRDQKERINWPKAGFISIREILVKLSIQVDENEYLPGGICDECRSTLENFYIFLEKIETNEELLKNVYLYDEADAGSMVDDRDEIDDNFSLSKRKCELQKNKEFIGVPTMIRIEHAYFKEDEISICNDMNDITSDVSLPPEENLVDFGKLASDSVQTNFEEDDSEEEQITIIAEEDDPEETTSKDYKKIDTEFGKYKVYSTPQDVVKIKVINKKKPLVKKKDQSKRKMPVKILRRKTVPKTEPEEVCIKQCYFCTKKFSNDDLRTIHYVDHVIQATEGMVPHRPFCVYCGLLTTTKDELDEHIMLKHNNKDDLLCHECDIKFSNISEVTLHEEKNHMEDYEEEIFTTTKCPICDKDNDSVEELIQHSLVHISRRYTCMACKKIYICSAALNEHHKEHPQYKHKCPICKKLTSGKGGLKVHMESHNLTRDFTCDVCGRKYRTKNLVMQHRKEHFKPNRKCTHCAYATPSKKDFDMHVRTHTTERPFICTFQDCNKAFKTNSALSGHVKSHLNLKLFKCDFCDYRSHRAHGLVIHRRKHTGEKPYECDVCLRTFSRSWYLTVHLRKIHGVYPERKRRFRTVEKMD